MVKQTGRVRPGAGVRAQGRLPSTGFGGAEAPLLQGGGADGSKLNGVAPTVVAPRDVEPDQNPL